MTPERFRRVMEIFEVVRSTPREARATDVDRLCAGDPELKSEVESMLREHDSSRSPLDGAVVAGTVLSTEQRSTVDLPLAPAQAERLICKIAVQHGYLSSETARSILKSERRNGSGRDLGAALLEEGLVTASQLSRILESFDSAVERIGLRDSDGAAARVERTEGEPSIRTVIGGYEIVELIGRGGMGEVYRARHSTLKHEVALKVLRSNIVGEKAVERFRREAEVAAKLEHPNIISLRDFGQTDTGGLYYTMPLVRGKDFATVLAEHRPRPSVAAKFLAIVAEGVDFAHKNGVIHRDLKPQNIMVTGKDQPVILDFGLAKRLDAQESAQLSQTGALMGTLSYMAPEQVRGDLRRIGRHTDVWALGAILYESLTGRQPFPGANDLDVMDRIQNRDPVPPSLLNPAVKPDLETICLTCLEKSPVRRYRTANRLAGDLRAFLENRPITAKPPSTFRRVSKFVQRRRGAVAFIATTILLLIAGAFVSFRQYSELRLASSQVTSLQSDASRLRREGEDLSSELERRRAELTTLRSEREALVIRVSALEGERGELRRRLEEATAELERVEPPPAVSEQAEAPKSTAAESGEEPTQEPTSVAEVQPEPIEPPALDMELVITAPAADSRVDAPFWIEGTVNGAALKELTIQGQNAGVAIDGSTWRSLVFVPPDLKTTTVVVRAVDGADRVTTEQRSFRVRSPDLGPYAARFDRSSLRAEGGSQETEAAVQSALQWLVRHQSVDGSWKPAGFSAGAATPTRNGDPARYPVDTGESQYEVGVTALALLALAGSGNTHRFGQAPELIECVRRGVEYLIRAQVVTPGDAYEGGFGSGSDEHWIYGHLTATAVLAELYYLTREPKLLDPLTKATSLVLQAQNPGAGWKYDIRGGASDTSVSGWAVGALKAAELCELPIPASRFQTAYRDALIWFNRATASNGKTGYQVPGDEGSRLAALMRQPGGGYPYSKEMSANTAVALHCRHLLEGSRSSAAMQTGLRLLVLNPPQWHEQDAGSLSTVNMYYWMFGTSAVFQAHAAREGERRLWNTRLQAALVATQRQAPQGDATWGDVGGSWDPIGEWGSAGGRIYSTAMGALALESYYRLAW